MTLRRRLKFHVVLVAISRHPGRAPVNDVVILSDLHLGSETSRACQALSLLLSSVGCPIKETPVVIDEKELIELLSGRHNFLTCVF